MDISLLRARNASMILGLTSCMAMIAPLRPSHILLLGACISTLTISIQWHTFGAMTWSMAAMGAIGLLLGGLSAVVCQLQRVFWKQSYRQRRQIQIMDRLTSLGRRTTLMVEEMEKPLRAARRPLLLTLEATTHAQELLHERAPQEALQHVGDMMLANLEAVEQQANALAQELQKIKAQTTLQHMGAAQRFVPGPLVQRAIQQARYQHAMDIAVAIPVPLTGYLRGDPKAFSLICQLLLDALHRELPDKDVQMRLQQVDGLFCLWLHADGMEPWWLDQQRLFTSMDAQRPDGLGTCRDLVRGFLGGELKMTREGGHGVLLLQAPLADQSSGRATAQPRAWEPAQVEAASP
jgi:hypothetical protein